MTLEKQLMRLTLRQLGELVEVELEVSASDRAGFERCLDVPLRMLERREFRTRAALRRFVVQKLEQAQEQARVRRIAAIFEAA